MSELCKRFEQHDDGQEAKLSTDDGGGVVGGQDSNLQKSTEGGTKVKDIAHNFENFDKEKIVSSLEPVLDLK